MDILYKNEDHIFSYRVGGILIQNEKILLQKPMGDDYSIIGGHVAAMETTAQTLKREFAEELHANVEVKELMAVGEVFFPWGKRPCHQISLYYRVELSQPAAIPMEGSFYGYDDLDHERINLEYSWLPLEELPNITVYPKALTAHILSGSEQVFHFISDQLTEGVCPDMRRKLTAQELHPELLSSFDRHQMMTHCWRKRSGPVSWTVPECLRC